MISLNLPSGGVYFSDNFFDLLPGEEKTIAVKNREHKPVSLDSLEITALNLQSN